MKKIASSALALTMILGSATYSSATAEPVVDEEHFNIASFQTSEEITPDNFIATFLGKQVGKYIGDKVFGAYSESDLLYSYEEIVKTFDQ
ncbi:hypothetical protein [Alteribacter populi]|uniref:hypothetical protein n=1 Tax=Alteribacter populi TaxID=2011011 RepID=UPI000BBADFFC|nr:hypothetical protein [Alteribacter populi]